MAVRYGIFYHLHKTARGKPNWVRVKHHAEFAYSADLDAVSKVCEEHCRKKGFDAYRLGQEGTPDDIKYWITPLREVKPAPPEPIYKYGLTKAEYDQSMMAARFARTKKRKEPR